MCFKARSLRKWLLHSSVTAGLFQSEDLASVQDKVQWVDPISVKYRDYTVYNNPPPGMGINSYRY